MPVRPPQQDRSRITRRRLLDSAVASLAQVGWTATSVQLVAGRAGVSRGAAQHHFPTRESLFEAVIDYITEQRKAELSRGAEQLPAGPERTEAVLQLLVGLYTGPLFRAALQIWTAASSEASLRARILPLEAELGRRAHAVALELLDVSEAEPGVRESVQATLDLARGLGLAAVLRDDSRRRGRVVAHWARELDRQLGR